MNQTALRVLGRKKTMAWVIEDGFREKVGIRTEVLKWGKDPNW